MHFSSGAFPNWLEWAKICSYCSNSASFPYKKHKGDLDIRFIYMWDFFLSFIFGWKRYQTVCWGYIKDIFQSLLQSEASNKKNKKNQRHSLLCCVSGRLTLNSDKKNPTASIYGCQLSTCSGRTPKERTLSHL